MPTFSAWRFGVGSCNDRALASAGDWSKQGLAAAAAAAAEITFTDQTHEAVASADRTEGGRGGLAAGGGCPSGKVCVCVTDEGNDEFTDDAAERTSIHPNCQSRNRSSDNDDFLSRDFLVAKCRKMRDFTLDA